MLLTLLISALLLMTIGMLTSPATQCLMHGLLTALCLLDGMTLSPMPQMAVFCSVIAVLGGLLLNGILKFQRYQLSSKELFFGVCIILFAITIMTYGIPPSISRLEFSILFAIIMVGFLYSILGKTIAVQIVGTSYILNALLLMVGLKGYLSALVTLLVFYVIFWGIAFWMTKRLGHQ